MIAKTKNNTEKNNINNIEFLLGKILDFLIEDNIIDVLISNCVINLSFNKTQAFKEARRVLKKMED